MREVSVRILHFLHEIARAAEVDEASLYEGFPAPAPREARHARGILGAHARRRAPAVTRV